jgi:Na+/H+-translocating membrane pyrophosphatase
MSQQPDSVRDDIDKLDAAGNMTKAVTKGYSIGSASMACFLLFGAFMDEFSEYNGLPFETVDIATPEVLVGGGLIGPFLFRLQYEFATSPFTHHLFRFNDHILFHRIGDCCSQKDSTLGKHSS